MSISWEKGFDPSVIVALLLANSTRDPNGSVSLHGFEMDEYLAVLRSMLRFEVKVSRDTAERIVTRAAFEALKKTDCQPSDVLRSAKKLLRDHLAKPEQRYLLVTSLNVSASNKVPRIQERGCVVTFGGPLAKKVSDGRREVFAKHKDLLGEPDTTPSLWVKVSVSARTVQEASERALDAIDLVRGRWNLFLNQDWRRTYGGRRKSVNLVCLGPLHTLHKAGGEMVDEQFWYEPHFVTDSSRVDLKKDSYAILKRGRQVRQRLKKNAYREEVESALLRFVRALDLDDYETSFVKLWGVLEQLTDTGLKNYDVTVRRASFMVSDPAYSRLVLEHLRRYRNRSVHVGNVDGNIEVELYQLKRFVRYLLLFHIGNKFGFSSLAEAGNFMDLSHDPKSLQDQIQTLRKGLKYLRA